MEPGRSWSTQEDRRLRYAFKHGRELDEMARALGRTRHETYVRCKELHLFGENCVFNWRGGPNGWLYISVPA